MKIFLFGRAGYLMLFVFLFNLLLVGGAFFIPSEGWVESAAFLFLLQFVSIFWFLFKVAVYAKDLFSPSVLYLLYVFVNFTLGAYLTSQGHGFFADNIGARDLNQMRFYPEITAYYLLANFVVFFVATRTLKLGAECSGDNYIAPKYTQFIFVLLFFFVSLAKLPFAFAFQFVSYLFHLSAVSRSVWWWRLVVYFVYLSGFAAFNYSNKREIAVALFAMIYFELRNSAYKLRFGLFGLVSSVIFLFLFLCLVIVASIFRGYGGFEYGGLLDVVFLIPVYVKSDFFLDAIVDNLELSYAFPAAYLAFESVLLNKFDYQFGLSYIKPLFFMFDRDSFSWKPESVMNLFTRTFDPGFYAIGGSYPVLIPSEAFANMHVLGILIVYMIFRVLDSFYLSLGAVKRGVAYYSCLFMVFTAFFFIRGSGLDLYVFYYIAALPLILFFVKLRKI